MNRMSLMLEVFEILCVICEELNLYRSISRIRFKDDNQNMKKIIIRVKLT